MNDKISGFGLHGNVTDGRYVDYNMYKVVNICQEGSGKHRNGRHRKKRRGGITDESFLNFRNELALLFEAIGLRGIEDKVFSTQRRYLERFFMSTHFSTLNENIRFVIKSRVDFLQKVKPSKSMRESVSWNAKFLHKIMGDVNLNSIINCSDVQKHLPSDIKEKVDIRLIYSFGKTIGSKILNYNKVLGNTGSLSYADIQNMDCSCDDSPFKHDRFGHIITGDLEIIGDPQLREICSFGTKFRENPYLNVENIKTQVKKEIDSFVVKLSGKFRISRTAFKKWKGALFRNFSNKLMACKEGTSYSQPVLTRQECKAELAKLQDRYVITVVDKAAGNFAFTCKKFYFLKLAEELGLNNENPGNETYSFSPNTENEIVSRIKTDLLQFRIEPNNREEKLALLYQTPKFHKNPPKMRYIAGNVSTVTSKLDRI